MKNSQAKRLSEELLNVDQKIVADAFEIDDAKKLKEYIKSKTNEAKKPFYIKPVFRRATAIAACLAIVAVTAFTLTKNLDFGNNLTSNNSFGSNKDGRLPLQSDNNERLPLQSDTSDENTLIENRFPTIKFSNEDQDVIFRDMVNLENGGFAVAGQRSTDTSTLSIIRTYDKDSNFLKEYTFNQGNGFYKIAACSDGGFITSSYNPPCITKVNGDFEKEWFMPYEDDGFWGQVHDVKEISPDLIAVVFVSINSPDCSRILKLTFLNKNGEVIEAVDLMNNINPHYSQIIADGQGGFYLLSTCDDSLAKTYPLVAKEYDSSKGNQAIIMRFSSERKLIWVKTLGGNGPDWIEEGTVDKNGNIYLAIGTTSNEASDIWEATEETSYPTRRILVKLNQNGDLIYKVPLSKNGRFVDEVYGIHVTDNKTYVIGMSDYYDGYQSKYPCDHFLSVSREEGERVFGVYNLSIDNNGKELDRKIFMCDDNNINNEPCSTILLPNGSIVLAGRVSRASNPFKIKFPSGVDTLPAIFTYHN